MNHNKQFFTIMSRINEMSPQFTKTDWIIYQFIKNNPEKFIASTASGIAKETNTSDASIIRFSQKVGFSGFYELRYMFQKELGKTRAEHQPSSLADLLSDNKVLLDRFYKQLSPNDTACLRDRMLSSKRIFIIALQESQHLAAIVAQRFLTIGILLQTVVTLDALKLHADLAANDDLCVVLCPSTPQKETQKYLKMFKDRDTYLVFVGDAKYAGDSICYDQQLILPKKNDLKSAYCISNELPILYLFDILFDSFLERSQCLKRLDKHTNDASI